MMKSRGCIGETRRDQQEPSLEGEECGPEGPWGPFREDWGGMNRSLVMWGFEDHEGPGVAMGQGSDG